MNFLWAPSVAPPGTKNAWLAWADTLIAFNEETPRQSGTFAYPNPGGSLDLLFIYGFPLLYPNFCGIRKENSVQRRGDAKSDAELSRAIRQAFERGRFSSFHHCPNALDRLYRSDENR